MSTVDRETVAARGLARLMLASVILTAPLFVCAPLFVDANFYGTCARIVLDGGVLERDVTYIFPPLMVWLRLISEGLLGGRSEWIRGFDLLWTVATVAALVRFGLGPRFGSLRWITWAILLALYVGTPTICHVQPDGWMLLPTVLALHLRRRQIARWSAEPTVSSRQLFCAALGEGVVGSLACLFKPQAIVILASLIVASYLIVRQTGRRREITWSADLLGWLCGGGLVLGVWMLWLIGDGGWSSFWANLPIWGRNYYGQRPPLLTRGGYLIVQFPFWSCVHLPMLWIALRTVMSLIPGLGLRETADSAVSATDLHHVDRVDAQLYAVFYLAWVVESVGMQWGLPYHLLPTLLVATRWFAEILWHHMGTWRVRVMCLVGVLVLSVNPLLMPERLAWLPQCFTRGSTPEVRDGLTTPPVYPAHWFVPIFNYLEFDRMGRDVLPAGMPPPQLYTHTVEWLDLERVALYLEQQSLGPRELTCYHNTTAHLYPRLGAWPATRWIWPEIAVAYFPQHEPVLREEFSRSGQHWVVSDLRRATLVAPSPSQANDQRIGLPDNFPEEWRDMFPWNQPIVFRAGRYAVHRVEQPVRELTGDVPPE